MREQITNMSLSNLLNTFADEKEVVKEEGKLVAKDKELVSLKGVLQRGRLRLGREKSPYPKSLNFSPSSITYTYCRRAKIGQLAGLMVLQDPVPPPKLQLTFDLGHAIHDIFQGYFWDIGILEGDFECLSCGWKGYLSPGPTKCPACNKGRRYLRYCEIQLRNEEYGIKGRSDGILTIDEERHIVDIKSIAGRTLKTSEMQTCFEDLDGPKEDHVVQLTLYMWMAKLTMGHLLYMNKADGMIKSYAVPYDYKVIEPYLNEIRYLKETAAKLKSGERVELPTPCAQAACACENVPSKIQK